MDSWKCDCGKKISIKINTCPYCKSIKPITETIHLCPHCNKHFPLNLEKCPYCRKHPLDLPLMKSLKNTSKPKLIMFVVFISIMALSIIAGKHTINTQDKIEPSCEEIKAVVRLAALNRDLGKPKHISINDVFGIYQKTRYMSIFVTAIDDVYDSPLAQKLSPDILSFKAYQLCTEAKILNSK